MMTCNPATHKNGYGYPCVPQESICLKRRRTIGQEWAKPVCNPDGSFRQYQCDAYSRARCWCVSDDGNMIPGMAKERFAQILLFNLRPSNFLALYHMS